MILSNISAIWTGYADGLTDNMGGYFTDELHSILNFKINKMLKIASVGKMKLKNLEI